MSHLREEASELEVRTSQCTLRTRVLINAAGLQADRLAQKLGVGGYGYQIIPFKGEYYELIPPRRHMVRSHLYSIPDQHVPFLGVHLSRTVDGSVRVGPGAVIAMGRERYGRFSYDVRDLQSMLSYPGFWRMWGSREFCALARQEWKKSVLKSAVVEEARRLVPKLTAGDFVRSRSGIRAQLVSRGGRLVDDLVIEETPRSLHLLNAVSSALTCALPYADYIASRIATRL